MTYEINKELALSTSHVSQETSQALAKGEGSVSVSETEYAWRIYCGSEDPTDMKDVPGDLVCLISLARANDCKWLVLDADGPVHDNLYKYDW